jgi:hypothetical protein
MCVRLFFCMHPAWSSKCCIVKVVPQVMHSFFPDFQALVLATGFRITDYFSPLEIIDKNGDNVLTSWKKDTPSLFMGIASHNLPNLFILYGPNTVSCFLRNEIVNVMHYSNEIN